MGEKLMTFKPLPSVLTLLCLGSFLLVSCQLNQSAAETETALTETYSVPTRTPRPAATASPTATPAFVVPLSELEGREIVLWHPWTGETGQVINALADEFSQNNEWGITVKVEQPGSSMILTQNVAANLGSDVLPQIVIAPSEDLLVWYDRDQLLLPLNDLVNDSQWGFSEQQRADIPLVFWQQDQVEGIQIGIPMQRTAQAIFYNQTWAAELGFRSAPITTAELQAQACAAAAANDSDDTHTNDGTGGWVVDTDGETIYAWVKAFGLTSPYKGDPPQLSLEQPATRQAFDYLRALVDQGCAWSTRLTGVEDLFATRQALFYTADLRTIPQVSRALERAGSSDQWVVLSFPGVEKPTVVVSGLSYGILNGSLEDNLAAWLFVRWMNQTDRELKIIETGGGLPVSTSAIQAADAYRRQYPQWSQAIQWIPYAVATPNSVEWGTARLVLGDAAWQALQSYLPADQIPAILSQLDDTIREISAQE